MAGNSLVKSFQCPNCGGVIKIAAAGRSVAATCGSCQSIIDVSNPELQIIQKAANQVKMDPLIPLGTRGKIFGLEVEVIGFLEKVDHYLETWREYLLFNPYKGFAWLVEYNNHWTFVQMRKDKPTLNAFGTGMKFNDKSFRHFAAGTAQVQYVAGEFYWEVKVGEKVRTVDYIAPPEILSMEEADGEVTWSHGTYVKRDDIITAFNVEVPHPFGVSPNQPYPFQVDIGLMWIIAVGYFFLFSIVSMFTAESYVENFFVMNTLLFIVPIVLSFHMSSFESKRYGE